MNLFKKKYVRSEWYQGLLDAEEFGKSVDWDTLEFYIRTEVMGVDPFETTSGWMDYRDYSKNILQKA